MLSCALPYWLMHLLTWQETLLPHKGDVIATFSRWQRKRVKPLFSGVNRMRSGILRSNPQIGAGVWRNDHVWCKRCTLYRYVLHTFGSWGLLAVYCAFLLDWRRGSLYLLASSCPVRLAVRTRPSHG